MATARILLYNAIFFILIAGLPSSVSSISCYTGNCKEQQICDLKPKKYTRGDCGFWIVLEQNCTYLKAVFGSVQTEEKVMESVHFSLYPRVLRYATNLTGNHPSNILQSNSNRTWHTYSVNTVNLEPNNSCTDRFNEVLCKLFAAGRVNASIGNYTCPQAPSTTPMVSTTTVLETTKSRTAFTTEATRIDVPLAVSTKTPPTGISTRATPPSTTIEATTDDNSEGSSLLWLYIVIAILIVLLIAGGVFGFFAWKKKWFKKWFKKDKKKAVKVELKKAEFPAKGNVLRPNDENPDLLPDNVWKKKGPIRMMKNLKGPIEHKMANDKSEILKKPIELDFDNMEEYQIGPGIEQYTGESTTLSFGPLPKSDTVRALTHISVSDMSTASKKPSTMEVKKETPKDSKRSKEDPTQKE